MSIRNGSRFYFFIYCSNVCRIISILLLDSLFCFSVTAAASTYSPIVLTYTNLPLSPFMPIQFLVLHFNPVLLNYLHPNLKKTSASFFLSVSTEASSCTNYAATDTSVLSSVTTDASVLSNLI